MSLTPSMPSVHTPNLRRGRIIALLFGLFLIAIGAFALLAALQLDGPLTPRLLLALIAVIALGLPTWAFALCLSRRLRTGHYLVDAEERRHYYAKTLAREASPTYRRLVKSVWVILSVFWLGLAAFWIRTVVLHPHKLPWACFGLAICALNGYLVMYNIRYPPFLTRPS